MATGNKTRNGHFVLIPLSMIRGLIKDPTLIYRIAMTGIYVSSQKLEVDFEEAIVTFIAIKYRDTLSLGIIMYEWYEKMKRNFPEQKELNKTSIVDKETHQINVNIDKEIEFLKIYGQKNPKFFDDLLAWYRVRMMIHLLEYEIDFLTMGSFEMGQQFMNERPELKTDPLIALDREVLRNMISATYNSSTELRARWAMYLGMLSIIGTKQMAITTSVAIKSRMFGAKDNDSLQEILKDKETKELYDYWTTRRHYERLLAEVETANKIKAQGLGRRTYISYRFKTDEDFVKAIEKGSVLRQVAKAKESRRDLLNSLRNSERSE